MFIRKTIWLIFVVVKVTHFCLKTFSGATLFNLFYYFYRTSWSSKTETSRKARCWSSSGKTSRKGNPEKKLGNKKIRDITLLKTYFNLFRIVDMLKMKQRITLRCIVLTAISSPEWWKLASSGWGDRGKAFLYIYIYVYLNNKFLEIDQRYLCWWHFLCQDLKNDEIYNLQRHSFYSWLFHIFYDIF